MSRTAETPNKRTARRLHQPGFGRSVKMPVRHDQKISNILCPTDLTARSQKALGFAARIAEHTGARITACHVVSDPWFFGGKGLEVGEERELKFKIREQINRCHHLSVGLRSDVFVVETTKEPADVILYLAHTNDVSLIVMKARPGVRSAVHFGSIVERVVTKAKCPVLLFPSDYLESHDPECGEPVFRNVLFDYDFSQATEDLFIVARSLAEKYKAKLHVVSVLEPPVCVSSSNGFVGTSLATLQTTVETKLKKVTTSSSISNISASTAWGDRLETLCKYADRNNIDLICTTLSPAQRYFEKLYKAYLGQLLATTKCPVLVKQSV